MFVTNILLIVAESEGLTMAHTLRRLLNASLVFQQQETIRNPEEDKRIGYFPIKEDPDKTGVVELV